MGSEREMKKKRELSAKERLMIHIKKQRPLPWQMYVCICVVIFCLVILCGKLQNVHVTEASAELCAKDAKVRVTVTGDIKVTDHVRKLAKQIGYDEILAGVTPYWKDADCVVASASGPVLRTNVKNYQSTREADEECDYMRPAAVRGFKQAGIDILNFANDDAYNYGTTGIRTTIEMMKESKLEYMGVAMNSSEPIYRTITYDRTGGLGLNQGKKIAFIGINDEVRDRSTVTETRAGIVSSTVNDLYTSIYTVSQDVEYTIVCVHFKESTKVTEEQRTLARAMIDAGADIIIGSNASLKAVEQYHGGVIVYGLGLLVSDEFFGTSLDSALFDLVVDRQGDASIYLTPVRLINGQAQVEQKGLYAKRIQKRLTGQLEKDSYTITDEGMICIPLK